jgi:hypothetical protein
MLFLKSMCLRILDSVIHLYSTLQIALTHQRQKYIGLDKACLCLNAAVHTGLRIFHCAMELMTSTFYRVQIISGTKMMFVDFQMNRKQDSFLFDMIVCRGHDPITSQTNLKFLPNHQDMTRSLLQDCKSYRQDTFFVATEYTFQSVIINYAGKDYELDISSQSSSLNVYFANNILSKESFQYLLFLQHNVDERDAESKIMKAYILNQELKLIEIDLNKQSLLLGKSTFLIIQRPPISSIISLE